MFGESETTTTTTVELLRTTKRAEGAPAFRRGEELAL